jgi:hypothetical protein
MTNQIQSVRGRVMRHASRYILLGLLVAGATWAQAAAAAGTTLKNVSYEALPGASRSTLPTRTTPHRATSMSEKVRPRGFPQWKLAVAHAWWSS